MKFSGKDGFFNDSRRARYLLHPGDHRRRPDGV
jgi:hypothetical protein